MKRAGPYGLYGLSLHSALPLPCAAAGRGRAGPVHLVDGEPTRFARARPDAPAPGPGDWFQYRRLDDGSAYLRWKGMFEFLVSADGRRIEYRSLPRASHEALTAYLLGQVLSFSLLASGDEPLHGTAVVVHGRAIAFLGDCGFGKSTLGAAFLRAGYPILTDDLLALKPAGAGYTAHPGIPRIKLFPSVARRVLRRTAGVPLNHGTSKQILPLEADQAFARPVRLAALYVLAHPTASAYRIAVTPVSRSDAALELVRNTFNTVVDDRDRLTRQFRFVSRLALRVPVKRLTYPRRLAALAAVVDAVLADLA
ncbi:MAG: hypothetical protein ACHQU1_07985 [Gemmatimonadales bacterium]